MSSTPVQLTQVDEILSQQLGSFTKLYKVSAPSTTVVNRAQVTDLSKDMAPKFGVNRIMTQYLQEVQGETGPNGERVFKALNDIHDQTRFVGSWTNNNDGRGAFLQSSQTTDYVEITFYGTGLNLLVDSSQATNLVAATDGGAEGANLAPASISAVLHARNYESNQIQPIVTGLTQGTHTVKIRNNTGSGLNIYGFEVLTAATTLQLTPGVSYVGGKKLIKSTLTTDAYASNFESGTLGTKGGHVVVYQKSDGSIGKAVQPTDASALYLSSASHTNESVIRSFSHREFGASRNAASGTIDDFSMATASGNYAFTLDDGTTSLAANAAAVVPAFAGGPDALQNGSSGSFAYLTFVGTGLDIMVAASAVNTIPVTVDGTSQGNITTASNGATQTYKVASGLPYGTHIVKLGMSFTNCGITRFVTYGPLKPSIPSGSVELADYYVMATFTAGTTAGLETIATGVLRKFNTREFVYSGTITGPSLSPTDTIGGWGIQSTVGSGKFSYTFFGTGFELRFRSAGAGSCTLNVDGSPNVSAYTTSGYGGASITNTTTGATAFTGGAVGAGIRLSGLTLGVHTVDVTAGASAQWLIEAIDVIAPIHTPKSDIPGDVQNTLTVGSSSLGDSRKFTGLSVKTLSNWAQAVGITSSPTTTSVSYVPMPDMTCVIKTSGNPIDILFAGSGSNSGTASGFYTVYVDGLQASQEVAVGSAVGGISLAATVSAIVPVAAGVHIVQVYWRASATTQTAEGTRRMLKVREL